MMSFRKKHGVRHWLVVILIRWIKFVIALVLGVYFFSFGFWLSKLTLEGFISGEQLSNVCSLTLYLPHFPFIKKCTIDLLVLSGGLGTWWAMVVGIPLMLIGISALLINFFSLVLAVFDYVYSLGHCPWYEWHKLTVDVLKNGRNHGYKKQGRGKTD